MTAMIARTPGASPDAVMKAKGATSTAPTVSEKKVVVVGGTFLSLYCNLTTKLEMAPLAAAPRTARDERHCDRERPEQDRLQGTAHYVPDGLSRPPTFDEDYHQETKRTDCGLEERNLSTHALISM
jgi:hypothetical protein